MLCILGLFTVSVPSGAGILRFYVIGCTSVLEWSPEADLKMKSWGSDPKMPQEK